MCKNIERLLAYHCSPALVGIKSANLMNCNLNKYPQIMEDIKKFNDNNNSKISFEILGMCEKRALILVYQRQKLQRTIFEKNNYEYLVGRGYPQKKDLDLYIQHLKLSIELSDSFPHEVGVFLGYALDDIIDFEAGTKECLYVGYWKVFSNKEEKIRTFDRYTRCKNIIFRLLDKGYSLESMI